MPSATKPVRLGSLETVRPTSAMPAMGLATDAAYQPPTVSTVPQTITDKSDPMPAEPAPRVSTEIQPQNSAPSVPSAA